MPRKAPRTRADGEWTEARFWGFVRSGLRQMSRKWGPIHNALRRQRRPYTGDDRRRKWEYQCERCNGWFHRKEVQVDHVVECGSCRSYEEAAEFLRRLLVDSDGLAVLCKQCHKEK